MGSQDRELTVRKTSGSGDSTTPKLNKAVFLSFFP